MITSTNDSTFVLTGASTYQSANLSTNASKSTTVYMISSVSTLKNMTGLLFSSTSSKIVDTKDDNLLSTTSHIVIACIVILFVIVVVLSMLRWYKRRRVDEEISGIL